MVVNAVVVIKETVSDVEDGIWWFPSNICSFGLRLGRRLFDNAISNNKEKY
jgi:hypothetical protein